MTHMYIKICDNCGKPCEVDSGLHGGSISSDIIILKGKISKVVFREEFDLCIECITNTGLGDILQKIKLQKEANSEKKIGFKKLLQQKKILPK